MNLSTILEVAIAVVFIYILLALVILGISEIIAKLFRLRSRGLANGLRQLLGEGKELSAVVSQFMPRAVHAEANPAAKLHERLPDGIPNRTFALAFIDALAEGEAGDPFETLKTRVKAMAASDKTRLLKPLAVALETVGDSKDAAVKAIEGWFDSSMQAASEWYRRRTQTITIILAAVLAVLLNADTIAMTRAFWRDSGLRAAVVAAAEDAAEVQAAFEVVTPEDESTASTGDDEATADEGAAESEGEAAAAVEPAEEPALTLQQEAAIADRRLELLRKAQTLDLPIGWTNPDCRLDFSRGFWKSLPGLLLKLLGWILTAAAVSLGAPFWFDMLRRLTGLRAALKKRESET